MLARAATHPGILGLLAAEAKTLTDIGNKFSVRHSETTQIPLETQAQAEWLFGRLWALIELVAPAPS